MTIFHLLSISAIIALTSGQKIPAHVVSSIIQDILSPKNTDQLSQLIKRTANDRKSESPMPNKRNIVSEAGSPKNSARNELVPEVTMPRTVSAEKSGIKKIVIQRPNEVVQPKNGLLQNAMPNTILVQKQIEGGMPLNILVQKANELSSPTKIVIKKPELAMPNNVIVKNPESASNRRILVQKANEIPMLNHLFFQQGHALTKNSQLPSAIILEVTEEPQVARLAAEVNPSGIIPQTTADFDPEKVIASNPFMPIASPVSSLTMSSGIPQSRGQFLRKIPVPPPTL